MKDHCVCITGSTHGIGFGIAEAFAKKGAKILHMSQGNGILLEVSFVPTPRIRKSKDIYFLDDLVIKGTFIGVIHLEIVYLRLLIREVDFDV